MPHQVIDFLVVVFTIRVSLVVFLQWLFVEKGVGGRLIYRVSYRPGQSAREVVRSIVGFLIDSVFLFILLATKLLVLNKTNFYEFVVFLMSHMFIVEPVYYWYHRALHTKRLYRKHHFCHHASVVAMPATAFSFTVFERASYTVLFSIPVFFASACGFLSYAGILIYLVAFDLANAVGHFNYEIFPKSYAGSVLRWFFYSPVFHALHHSRFNSNYSLFMPIYDRIFKTYDPVTEYVFVESVNHRPQERIGKIHGANKREVC